LYYPPDLIAEIEMLLPNVDETRRARASLQQTTQLLGQGDLPGAKQAAERGRLLYAQQNNIWGELEAAHYQIEVAYRAGDLVTMRRLLTELRDLSVPIDQPDIQRALMVHQMRLAVYEGDWFSTLQLAQQLSSSQQSHFDPSVAWLSLANLGLAYMKLGAFEAAYDIAQQAVAASEDAEVLGLGARVLLAKLELGRGNHEQARDMLLNLLEKPDPLMGESDVVSPALALVRCYIAAGDNEAAKEWAHRAAQAVSRVRLPLLFPLSQVAWVLAYLDAKRYEDAHKRLHYPLEYMLLMEDTSPQEIYVLRAAAARGLGKKAESENCLRQAWETVQQQADHIPDETYCTMFLNQIPLHQFISTALTTSTWKPEDVPGRIF
jgi:tetratricopeptide (TPR) repeat protein